MDQLPARLRTAAGDEPVIESVDLGGGDALVVTPSATHVYRAEGLLSDETVESYRHAVDRFAVQQSRRKRTMVLESIDGERRFTVPARAGDAVAEAVLEGILRTIGVVDRDEAVEAIFRFSDLTLVVTDATLFKHVGPSVWNEDFEMFDFDSLTGLDFEEGSVATQVVVEIGGRQHRVKVPNERAGRVRREIQDAVFEYHDVSSLDELRATIGAVEDDAADGADEPVTSVTEPAIDATDDGADTEDGDDAAGTAWSPPADQDVTGPRGRATNAAGEATAEPPVEDGSADDATGDDGMTDDEDTVTDGADTVTDDAASGTDASAGDVDGETGDEATDGDVAALAARIEALEAQLDRQSDLLEEQTETIDRLVDELRRGR